MKYYLKATSSTCYDKTGITFPVRKQIDLKQILKQSGAKRISWCCQFGWSNQPQVICFNIKEGTKIEGLYSLGLIVAERTW